MAVAGHGKFMWTIAIHGTVPEIDIVVVAAFLRAVPVVDASIVGAHKAHFPLTQPTCSELCGR